MSIKPTYLYIKRHTVTGLKYFGKTVKSDVKSYKGSGKYWKNHIKEHGSGLVETFWISEPFIDKNDLVEFATFFSEELDIVNSDEWANLTIENGLDGGDSGVYPTWLIGHRDSEETKNKRAKSISGAKNGMYGKTGKSNPFYGKSHSIETILKLKKPKTEEEKKKYREAKRPIGKCPHCGKEGHLSIMKRWHFEKCKVKNSYSIKQC